MSTYIPHVVAAIVERLSYKPGWHFDCWHGHDSGMIWIGISGHVDNARAPGQTQLMFRTGFEERVIDELGPKAGAFIEAKVVAMIHDLELHEADEWLRFNGKMLNDPHERRSDALDN